MNMQDPLQLGETRAVKQEVGQGQPVLRHHFLSRDPKVSPGLRPLGRSWCQGKRLEHVPFGSLAA